MTAVIDPYSGVDAAIAEADHGIAHGADWRTFARCQKEPGTFAIVEINDKGDEPPYPTAAQTTCCNLCPVRTDCLNHALAKQEPAGVWGGMTTYQRGLLSKVYSRKSCPGCSSNEIIIDGHGSRQHEVCVSCGVSWPA